MTKAIHPIAGTLALLTILSFWISTVTVELFASHATVAWVKSLIPWGFLVLIPAMMAAGISGAKLSKKMRGPVIARKSKRMPVIAANGVLVLIPAAFFLSFKAQAGEFDGIFYAVQGLELLAGATNITLLSLNMCDGLRLTAHKRKK